MIRIYLTIILSHLFLNQSWAINDTTCISILKKQGKEIYACSQHSIYILKNNKPTLLCESIEPITDILPLKESFIYCTDKKITLTKSKNAPINIRHKLTKPHFVSLCEGVDGKIYVASLMDGLFEIKGDSLELIHYAFPVNSINASSDSSIWLATNIGLLKLKNGLITTYKEEGTGNFEIADNHVEKLLLDNIGDIWVKMSQAISVITSEESTHHHEHLPTIKFIGSVDNEIYSVSFHKKLGYLFSTKEGMILMPIGNKEDNHKFFEIAEAKASENPLSNLNVLKKVYSKDNQLLMGNCHVMVNSKTIAVCNRDKVVFMKMKNLNFN